MTLQVLLFLVDRMQIPAPHPCRCHALKIIDLPNGPKLLRTAPQMLGVFRSRVRGLQTNRARTENNLASALSKLSAKDTVHLTQ